MELENYYAVINEVTNKSSSSIDDKIIKSEMMSNL